MSPQTDLKAPVQAKPPQGGGATIPNLRWWICGLLFFATTINYVDRTAVSTMKPHLKDIMHWSEADFAWIMFFFTASYAIFPTISGRLLDSLGVKIGLAVALVGWSVMAGVHAFVPQTGSFHFGAVELAYSVVGFSIARFLLGLFEAANFPAAIKTVAMWFPQKERAVSTGIFNSGTSIGVILTWGLVSIAEKYGWRWAFILIGLSGFVWLFFWQMLFNNPEEHPRLSKAELDYIKAGQPAAQAKESVHWTILFRYKEVWPFLIGKFLTDPVWWFYLYWLVSILVQKFKMPNLNSAGMLIYPYTAAMVGSIAGGWFSGHLIKKGWKTGSARYLTMAICAVCMPGSIVAAKTDHVFLAMGFISLACAAHQGWSANIFTIASDLFESRYIGSIVGMGATAGGVGGMLMTLLVGVVLMWMGDGNPNQYTPILIWAGVMHITSLLIFFSMAGLTLKRVEIDPKMDQSKPCLPLVVSGILLAAGGFIGSGAIWANRVALVEKALHTYGALAGGVTAAAMIGCIGLILIIAGLPRNNTRRA